MLRALPVLVKIQRYEATLPRGSTEQFEHCTARCSYQRRDAPFWRRWNRTQREVSASHGLAPEWRVPVERCFVCSSRADGKAGVLDSASAKRRSPGAKLSRASQV